MNYLGSRLSGIFAVAMLMPSMSCRKDFPSLPTGGTPAQLSLEFVSFWEQMNTGYVYWDIDTTNWDSMYIRYLPLFSRINQEDTADLQQAVTYFRQMTGGLIDGHYNLSFLPAPIADSFLYPALERKIRSPSYHNPFDYASIDRRYFDSGYLSGTYVTSANIQISATCATIGKRFLYFQCDGFALQEAYDAPDSNGVRTVLQSFFSHLHHPPPGIHAVVIDVRNNSGGELADLDFLVGQFIGSPLRIGYTHYKSGNGRLEFTPWIPALVLPQAGSEDLTVPIVVLADAYSASLSEAVTMAIKAIPHSLFIGETTWGATGPITESTLYDDGPFTVTGFLSVYTSSAAFRYIDGKNYEGQGFPPDVPVPFHIDALYAGDDPVLDTVLGRVQ